jgi:hypothetical protein
LQAQTVWELAETQLPEQQTPLPVQAAPLFRQQKPDTHEPRQQGSPPWLQARPGLTQAEPVVEPEPLLEVAVAVVVVVVPEPELDVAELALPEPEELEGPALVAAVSALPVAPPLEALGQMQLPLKVSQLSPPVQSPAWQRPETLQRLGSGSQKPLWQSRSAVHAAQSAAAPVGPPVVPLTSPPLFPQPAASAMTSSPRWCQPFIGSPRPGAAPRATSGRAGRPRPPRSYR